MSMRQWCADCCCSPCSSSRGLPAPVAAAAAGSCPPRRTAVGGTLAGQGDGQPSGAVTRMGWCGAATRTVSPERRPAVRAGAGTRADVSFG